MPELPEVQTTVSGLEETVKGKTITDVWSDISVSTPSLPYFKETIKSAEFFERFKSIVIGSKIVHSWRRGKNICIDLSNDNTIWIHMKMTGHLLYGQYQYIQKENIWKPSEKEENDSLRDPFNRFLHIVFSLSNGKHLVLSDVRKFAKVTMFETNTPPKELLLLGPEPLDPSFSLKEFKRAIQKRPLRPIKEVLLDQQIIAGIGNIYSDEMLWLSDIHPFRIVKNISETEYKKMYRAMKRVLNDGLEFGGDSTSDYRDIHGNPGSFQHKHAAYRNTGKECRKRGCKGTIMRMPFGGRGAHFCPEHQK